jgi:hypothetical protein
MEAHEYPVRHFEMMAVIAEKAAGLGAQLLEHTYDYNHFGSWWFVCSYRNQYYRCVFDGRDGNIRLERSVDPRANVWAPVDSRKTNHASERELVLQMLDHIRQT